MKTRFDDGQGCKRLREYPMVVFCLHCVVGGMMWGTCDLVWGIVGNLGVGGTPGDGVSPLSADVGKRLRELGGK